MAISFLNNFVAGALTLLIPLLLLARNVNLADIGLVLSVLPIVFLVARLLLAAVADHIGWTQIFAFVNWPAAVFATVIYYFAASLPAFVAGKVIEGLRESSYWAVTRTAIFHLAPKQAEREATKNNAVIWIATAIGSAAAGMGLAYMGFSATLIILMVVSAAICVPAVMLWKTRTKLLEPRAQSLFKTLSPRGKSRTFWLASITLALNSLATYPLLNLLLPAFMSQQLGYSYLSIGVLFMLYNVLASGAAYLTLRAPLDKKRATIASAIGLVSSVVLASSGFLFPAFLLSLAFVRGLSIAFFEHLVAKVAKNSRNVSVDIGWVHTPMRMAEFASMLVAGFAAQTFGYAPVFISTGIFFATFCFLSLQILKQN